MRWSHYFVIAAAILCTTPARAQTQPPGRDTVAGFGEFLLSCKVVLIGTVLKADTARYDPRGICGETGPVFPALELVIQVAEVKVGTIPRNPCVIGIARSWGAEPAFYVGQTVIAWAHYECGDRWNLWGGAQRASDLLDGAAL